MIYQQAVAISQLQIFKILTSSRNAIGQSGDFVFLRKRRVAMITKIETRQDSAGKEVVEQKYDGCAESYYRRYGNNYL